MCGICGIVHTDRHHPVDRPLLQKMNETLHHRGPDGDGYFVNGNVGLAMCRLAIIDIVSGQQPIFNEDGHVVIVFNGEIYNFKELRDELIKHGHRFTTQSDTEVIVHAYEQWGDDALLRLDGMFAFALWDAARKRLLIARDRMGEKPLYWYYSSRGLLFGSEAKALLAAPWIERGVNALALHHYLTLQYTPDPLTIFEGIRQLPAAHKLVVEYGDSPQISRWWQLSFEPKWKISDGEAIGYARELLSGTVEQRLISEVPLGTFLSGGIDSSIIVALMAERCIEPVKTFTIGFEEQYYSETQYARQIAERYATDHHEFIFRAADIIRVVDGVVSANDEPFADPAALPLFELSRQTRHYVTVVLSGDGGDETLAGYRRYVFDGLLRLYTMLPKWFTQTVVPAIVNRLPELMWMPEDRNPVTALKRLGQFAAITSKASIVRWGSYFPHDKKLTLYTDRWRDEFERIDTADLIAASYEEAPAISLLDCTLYTDQVTYLAGDLMPKTDRMSMAHSVEARAPFLGTDWVEWTARLPAKFKVRGMSTKWLLKAAFADRLSKEIAGRGKQGFSVPIGTWLRHELRDWMHERLIHNKTLEEWFRPTAVEQLLKEHDSGKINHGKRIWALTMFAAWLERYQ